MIVSHLRDTVTQTYFGPNWYISFTLPNTLISKQFYKQLTELFSKDLMSIIGRPPEIENLWAIVYKMCDSHLSNLSATSPRVCSSQASFLVDIDGGKKWSGDSSSIFSRWSLYAISSLFTRFRLLLWKKSVSILSSAFNLWKEIVAKLKEANLSRIVFLS